MSGPVTSRPMVADGSGPHRSSTPATAALNRVSTAVIPRRCRRSALRHTARCRNSASSRTPPPTSFLAMTRWPSSLACCSTSTCQQEQSTRCLLIRRRSCSTARGFCASWQYTEERGSRGHHRLQVRAGDMTRTSRAASSSHTAMTCGTRARCAEATPPLMAALVSADRSPDPSRRDEGGRGPLRHIRRIGAPHLRVETSTSMSPL
jgi:hypothetical protein